MNSLFSETRIEQLEVLTRLGVYDWERRAPQMVWVNIRWRSAELPLACINDELSSTICYEKVSEAVLTACVAKEYHLIEHLAQMVYASIKEIIPPSIELSVCVSKPHVPIDAVKGGTHFTISDWALG